jgi:hypothetical protein
MIAVYGILAWNKTQEQPTTSIEFSGWRAETTLNGWHATMNVTDHS